VDDGERRSALVAAFVGVMKALRRFGDDVRGDPRGNARALLPRRAHELAGVVAFDVLHREHQAVGVLDELVDLHDVRVVQPRREVGLFDEHRAEAPRRRVRGVDPLEDE
jgi:hypothetical protein